MQMKTVTSNEVPYNDPCGVVPVPFGYTLGGLSWVVSECHTPVVSYRHDGGDEQEDDQWGGGHLPGGRAVRRRRGGGLLRPCLRPWALLRSGRRAPGHRVHPGRASRGGGQDTGGQPGSRLQPPCALGSPVSGRVAGRPDRRVGGGRAQRAAPG